MTVFSMGRKRKGEVVES